MKKFFLLPIVLTAACSEIPDSYVPVHIGANTNADIYVDSRLVGTTPAFVYLSPDFLKDGRITLKKQGFVDAEIKTNASFKTRKKIASTSSDERVSGYLKAKYDLSADSFCGRAGRLRDIFDVTSCVSTSAPTEISTRLPQFPVSSTQYSVPYTVVEYGAQQYFVTMRRNDQDDSGTLPVQIRNLILKYYPPTNINDREDLVSIVSKTTGFSNPYLIWLMSYNQSTPDGAAKAVSEDLRLLSDLERSGEVDAVNALKKATGLSEKVLRHAVSSDKGKARGRITALVEFIRLKGEPRAPERLLPKCDGIQSANDFAVFLVNRQSRSELGVNDSFRAFAKQAGVSAETVKKYPYVPELSCEIVKEAERQNRIDGLILKSF